MSEYRAYMQNTKLHNGTKRKKRRHRFLFGVLLSALLITGALYGREHEPGNHSEHHYDMATITAGEMKTEIMDVHKKVKELTGKDMKVFRPPYGSYNNELIDTVYGCDYYPIQWDVDSLDWKNYGMQNIIDTVCNHKSLDCGSIILCHLGAKYTSQALDEMLTKLQDMGYEIVPVSKLIMTEGYHMDANGMQIKD